MAFSKDILKIDCEREAQRICAFIREHLRSAHREGVVIGLSGGVDSALSAALSVKAIGKDRVFALVLPEKESSPQSRDFALKQARQLGIDAEVLPITPVLEAFGTYEKKECGRPVDLPRFCP